MNKILASLLLLAFTTAHAGEAEIRQAMQSKYPGIGKLEHIVKTPLAGIYEMVIDEDVYYIDESGRYLVKGEIIDLKTDTNLTEQLHQKLTAIDFNKLPLDLAVKKVKGNGKRKMAYFTDPQCSFCKRLEVELSKIDNVTLYIFMHPIFDGSNEITDHVLCAKNPVKTWDDLMLKGIKPASAACKTSTGKVLALGKKLALKGTPLVIFADGTRGGYAPAAAIEKRLDEAAKK